MIRKVLPFAANYLKKSNLKKSVSSFARTHLLSAQLGSKAFTGLSTTFSFQFSTDNVLSFNNSPQSFNIVEITDYETFKNIWTQAEKPVVLVCYDHRYEPSEEITSRLEEKAREANGKWILARFDVDYIPKLTEALELRSGSPIILVHNSKIIQRFEGPPTDEVFATFFQTIEKLCRLKYSSEQHQAIFNQAINHLSTKNFAETIKLLKQLSESEYWIEDQGALTTAALSLAYIRSGDKQASKQALQELGAKYEQDLEIEGVKAIVQDIQKEFEKRAAATSELEEMKSKLESDPENNDLRIEIAQYAIEHDSYEEAIETLLDIMKIDKNFKDKFANNLLLEIFAKLGATNPLVVQGRKEMQKILF